MSVAAATANLNAMEMPGRQALHLPRIAAQAARNTGNNHVTASSTRAMSRTSSLGDMVDRFNNEHSYPRRAKEFSNRLERSFDETDSSENFNMNIPEGIKAIYTPDIKKVSMPIFGW